jgi:hypothetical protein
MSSDFERFLETIRPVDRTSPEVQAERVRRALKLVLKDLARAGVKSTSLAQLRHSGRPWHEALPILSKWLPKVTEPGAKEEIVRTLSVPWVGRSSTAQLITEFKSADSNSSLAWAIGNALSIVDVTGFEKEIIELVRDDRFGMARQMLVMALGKIGGRDAEDAAMSALQDKDLVLHAIDALRAMHSTRAVSPLRELLHDKRLPVRKAAKKALQELQKG